MQWSTCILFVPNRRAPMKNVGANPPKICKWNLAPLIVCFRRLQIIHVICFLELWSVSLLIILSFIFDVSPHSTSANILVDHLRFLKNNLGKLRSGHGCLLWTISQFNIDVITKNASMRNSACFTAKACVIRSLLINERNAELFMSQGSSLPCFNLQRLFDWRVRLFEQPNCFRVLRCDVLSSNAKDARHFFNYVRHKV